MLPFFLLGFFPNLHNLHPAELSETYGVLGNKVDMPNCRKENFDTSFCLSVAKLNLNLTFSSYASSYWTMDGIMNYEKEVKYYECFKASNCSNAKQMKTIHDKSLSIVKTVLGKSYSCLRDNHITAFNDIEICARGVRSFSDYLTFCTKPAIRNFKCSEEDKALVAKSVELNVELIELVSEAKKEKYLFPEQVPNVSASKKLIYYVLCSILILMLS
ncbi:unnamed protein product [Caenorhabditis brenneri]